MRKINATGHIYHKNKPVFLSGEFLGTEIVEDHEEQHVHGTRRARRQEADNTVSPETRSQKQKGSSIIRHLNL